MKLRRCAKTIRARPLEASSAGTQRYDAQFGGLPAPSLARRIGRTTRRSNSRATLSGLPWGTLERAATIVTALSNPCAPDRLRRFPQEPSFSSVFPIRRRTVPQVERGESSPEHYRLTARGRLLSEALGQARRRRRSGGIPGSAPRDPPGPRRLRSPSYPGSSGRRIAVVG